MKKSQKANVKSGAIVVLIIVVMVGYYFYLSNKDREVQEQNPQITAVQEVLMRNLDTNYPATPKEVIKYYSEITKCFYNEEYTDGELEELADKADQLYDDQLAEHEAEIETALRADRGMK